LKAKILALFKNDFLKNVSILAFGSILGQAILLGVSPLLTRLYEPEQFGNLATFTAVLTILATFSTGKYEFAVLLPDQDKDGAKLVHIGSALSVVFGVLTSILFLSVVLFFKDSTFLKMRDTWAFLIPFGIILAGISSSVLYWLHRTEQYRGQAIYNLVFSISNAGISVLFGFLYLDRGLECATIIAFLISLIVLAVFAVRMPSRPLSLDASTFADYQILAKRYVNFPRFHILTQLLTNISQHATPLIFAYLYPPAVVGLFALSNRVLRTPVIVVSSSVTSVFRNEILKEINLEHGHPRRIIFKTLKHTAFITFPIFVVLVLFLPHIFQFVFGEKWYEAGVFGRVLCFMIFLDLVLTPLSQSLFIVLEAQKNNLLTQILSVILSSGGIFLGYLWDKQMITSLIGFSIGASLSLIFSFFWACYVLDNYTSKQSR
jgi:teichuronic acid exporter